MMMMNYNITKITARDIKLSSDDTFKIENDTIILNNKLLFKDRIKIIIKNFETFYNIKSKTIKNNELILKEYDINDLSLFLLPLLFKNKNEILFSHNLINTYLKIDIAEIFNNEIYIVFRYTPFEYYFNFINNLKTINNNNFKFKNKLKGNDTRFDILCFTIKSKKILKIIKLILNGEFIMIPKINKLNIINFNQDEDITGMLLNTKKYRASFELKYGFDKGELDEDISLRNKPILKDLIWHD